MGKTETAKLPTIIAMPEQDVTIPKTDEPPFGLGSTYPGNTASKADATRLTPEINKISAIISGFSLKNISPSLARTSTLSFLSFLFSGILTKNNNAVNATRKLLTSTAITPLSPINEYNAVAIKGFNIEIRLLDRERSPQVLEYSLSYWFYRQTMLFFRQGRFPSPAPIGCSL